MHEICCKIPNAINTEKHLCDKSLNLLYDSKNIEFFTGLGVFSGPRFVLLSLWHALCF